jgi:hypothetical protein
MAISEGDRVQAECMSLYGLNGGINILFNSMPFLINSHRTR